VRKSNGGTSQNKKRPVQIRVPVLWARQMQSPPRRKTWHRLAGRMHGGEVLDREPLRDWPVARRCRKCGRYSAELRPEQNCSPSRPRQLISTLKAGLAEREKSGCLFPRQFPTSPWCKLSASWQKVDPVSLLLFNRAFYPNLVRATIAGNVVTMAGSFLVRFSDKGWLLFPFGDRGLGALGDVVFNTCWVFALICVGTILRQSYSTKRRSQVRR